ncbi:MAG: malonyl-CoA synthase [Pseudomonadales bacterium]|nr:malonyl-CoA synthase [Pseudomonadales bacterium]
MNANLYDLIFQRSAAGGPAIADASGAVTLDYPTLHRQAGEYAACFKALGLAKGDRIVVQVEKSVANLLAYLGALKAGLIYLPLNTAYQEHEVEYFLGDAEPSLVVCDPSKLAMYERLASCPVRTLDADGAGTLPAEVVTGATSETEVCGPDDVAAILYTSGTTGQPKGAMITHGNLASNGLCLIDAWGFEPGDVLLHALPIFHVHGLFVAANVAMMNASPMIFLARFDAATIISCLPRATVYMGVPTHYTRMLDNESLSEAACANMRLFTSGSAPLLESTFAAWQARTGHTILERYGMTETGMNTSNPLHGTRKPGTVGPPLPGVTARIVDDEGQPVATGVTGNLQVKGENVFKGYWRKPEKTREDFEPDGFFKTGDLAQLDADGYVSIVGRSKDLVITGGLNVYPKELEYVIDRMPGVVESAVIGLPDPDFGEAVTAVIVPEASGAPSEAEVIAYMKEKLANFKVAKQVFFVDALPRNTMGKVQKNMLRQQFGD